MLDFTDSVVCHAKRILHRPPSPVLAIEDRLVVKMTYLVLPVNCLPQGYDNVTTASLAGRAVLRQGHRRDDVHRRRHQEPLRVHPGRRRPEFIVRSITSSRPIIIVRPLL
uniref:Uncharacterized protein n=1 Tax=Oryza punctata TaxID=4537 RepID=A0A0E0JY10_ORYPU